MSTQRTYKAPYPKERGPNGRRICRGGCGVEVPKGKLYWCANPACLDGYMVRSNPQHARKRVRERDKCICAQCGRDAKRIGRIMRALRERAKMFGFDKFFNVLTLGKQAPYRAWRFWRDHDWEMDHILPVVEGGGQCGLDNLRTLCLACHQQATADLARRRAARRRGVDQVSLPLLDGGEKNFIQPTNSTFQQSFNDQT